MALKKKFFNVELENLNLPVPILASNPENIVGQVIRYDLTKLLRGKNCEARFKIQKDGERLIGVTYFFMLQPAFIKKMIGRNISIVEDSFLVKCKDASLRIKPFLITRKRVHRSVRNHLRRIAKEFITQSISELTKQKVFQEIISSSLQRALSKKLKEIYPLAICEIRVVKLEN